MTYFKDEPRKKIKYNDSYIVFDDEGIYKTGDSEIKEYLVNNCYYEMPPKMVEAYHYQQKQKELKKALDVKRKESKKKESD